MYQSQLDEVKSAGVIIVTVQTVAFEFQPLHWLQHSRMSDTTVVVLTYMYW